MQNIDKDFISSKNKIFFNELPKKELNDELNNNINIKGDINELPITQAIRKDKRSFFKIFMSIIIQKIELINLIFGDHKIKILLVFQYIFSLIMDFFNTYIFIF